MRIIKTIQNSNGSYDNQTWHGVYIPDGYAIVPDELETPNFPFGNAEFDETMQIVMSWTPNPIPEPEPEPLNPTQADRIEAQVLYTALMTDTLLEE